MTPLTALILERYADLLTPAETAAHARLLLTRRATAGDTSPEAQAAVTASPINQRQFPLACSNDPEVVSLALDGLDAFAQRAATRILRDYGEELDLPRCPKCRTVFDPPASARCSRCEHGPAEAQAEASA